MADAFYISHDGEYALVMTSVPVFHGMLLGFRYMQCRWYFNVPVGLMVQQQPVVSYCRINSVRRGGLRLAQVSSMTNELPRNSWKAKWHILPCHPLRGSFHVIVLLLQIAESFTAIYASYNPTGNPRFSGFGFFISGGPSTGRGNQR